MIEMHSFLQFKMGAFYLLKRQETIENRKRKK